MKLIVGLGNPGEKYQNTRHNLGFFVLDALLEKLMPLNKTFWEDEKKFRAQIKKTDSLMLAKPTTFMNASGLSVAKILNYYKMEPQDLIVVHDDLDLPFGKIRVRFGGGAGGHHGVENIIEQIKTDTFLRIRLGIGNPRRIEGKNLKSKNPQNVEEYVLGNISSSDRGKVKTMTKETIRIIERIQKHGLETYMSKYNS